MVDVEARSDAGVGSMYVSLRCIITVGITIDATIALPFNDKVMWS
jgi:hypothetical protein